LGFEELTPKGVPDSYYLPFSMTEGRDEGSTIRWQLTTDYNIGYGLVASATYDARYNKNITLPGNIIHTARAEIRATF
jgi:hypothetical protein